jgi:uncharacterized protein (DUF2384 family)
MPDEDDVLKNEPASGPGAHTVEWFLRQVAQSRPERDFAGRYAQASESNQVFLDYADVLTHAVETFGSRVNANAWLKKPNRVFHNQTPLQILTEDPAAVEEELVRIDHGMFI